MQSDKVRWQQVVACLVLQGVSAGTITSAFSVLAVPFAAEFGLTRMVVMLAMTLTLLVTALLSPVVGRLLDQLSIRVIMLIGSVALSAGFAGLSLAHDYSQMLILYALLLAPANVLIGPLSASVLVSRWFDRDRGRALGLAAIGISVGGFLFPPLIQGLIESFGWRPALQILAIGLLILTLAACYFIRDRRPDGDGAHRAKAGVALTMRAVMVHREFWLMTAVFGILLTGMMGLVTNMVPLAQAQGIPIGTATLLISALALGSLLGKVIFAIVADRAGPRIILLFGITGFVTGLSCILAAHWGFWIFALGSALVGLTNGAAIPLQAVVAARIFGLANVGRVVGLLNFVVMMVGLAVPPAFGMIYDRSGRYDAALMAYIVLAVGAVLATVAMRGADASRDSPSEMV
ncbi:MFS transporter [Sphingobium sufflavum]|uniref:MFS transporter n=1 Tax=Sphingobium sufflavum TaxID=1129547 RepID=UPI001F40CB7C|nr:MFS transporter [Sphingobium sufflavum]MCE7796436.1 MFS transporter [Sphingobium sufflavum]